MRTCKLLEVIAWEYTFISHFHARTHCSPHLPKSPSFHVSHQAHHSLPPPLYLDNITAYYFSYFHFFLCLFRAVSQAVMSDLELSLMLGLGSNGLFTEMQVDVSWWIGLSQSTRLCALSPEGLCALPHQTSVGVGCHSPSAKWDLFNDHLGVPSSILVGGFHNLRCRH